MENLFSVLGAMFLIYGVCLCTFSNLNLGVILIVFVGAIFFAYGIFYKKINDMTKKGILKYLKILIILFLITEFVLVSSLALYGSRDNVTYKEHAVLVLGAGIRGDRVTLPLQFRLDKAIEYTNKNPNALIVVSGGKGFQETVTEAYAMEKYLIENGIDKNKIIKEEKATSTRENMKFSKEILDGIFDKPYEAVVITNGFHIYRGVSMARKEGFEKVTHFHAGLQWYNILPCYLRESLAVLKMWIME